MAGYIEMPGGWCVPNDQAIAPISTWPGYDDHADDDEPEEEDSGPPRFQRGGIKYPTPRKAHIMALTPKQQVRKLEAELDSNLSLQQALKVEAAKLRADIKRADRPEPTPSMGTKWWIAVAFKTGGHEYDFLVLRVGEKYYTTGTSKSGVFPSWEAFLAWLDAEAVSHSTMVPLTTTGGPGPLATKPPTEVGF